MATPAPRKKAEVVSGNTAYAGFWLRVVAFLVDSIILKVAMGILGVGSMMGTTGMGAPQGYMGVGGLLSILISLAYFAGMESSTKQATLGKMLLSLKVTDMQGRRLTLLNAVGRHLAKFLSGLILGIGFLMVAFTEKKQGLHDIIAGTLVVKAK